MTAPGAAGGGAGDGGVTDGGVTDGGVTDGGVTDGEVLRVVRDPDRLAAVRATGLLDAPVEAAFDRLAGLAAMLLRTPLATVTLVDADRQFYTACVGLPEPLAAARQTPLDVSFCRFTVADAASGALGPLGDGGGPPGAPNAPVLAIPDTRLDPRTRGMASVTHYGVHAYAGTPLVADGRPVGTLCVMDVRPRDWTPDERAVLAALGRAAGTEVELRAANRRLTAQADALRAANARLQEQAAELAAQAEELQATAVLLGEQAEAAGAARAEAEVANRSKSEFLATMSHELRTPLNAIGGYAELLALGIHGPVTPEQRQALERVQRSQRHLLGLINGVLNYARVEAGAVHYELADVPLDEVLAACEALVAPQVRDRRLALVVGVEAPAPNGRPLAARADRDKVQQVVLNLLSNAVKFTAPGGRVALDAAADGGGRVRVRVADTGRGIAADQLERVFQPFVQVDAALTRAHEGTGLGLAISRDLARGMGGELTAESVLGEGSVFTLVLPEGGLPAA